MTARGRGIAVTTLVAVALILPGVASAHAYLVRTVPVPNATLNTSPPVVALTYDEAVEPRFAIISVTDAAGRQETTAPVRRSPANPDTLVVPLRPHLPEGWYLVYWRAISVDGHPVQGAYTFAIGPNAGPPPQFRVPSIAQTATTPKLLIARWLVFLTVMIAIGLFVLRIAIARPLVKRVDGTSLRAVSVAMVVFTLLGLVAIPVYLDVATAIDSLRSDFAVGALVPLFRVTAFGRGYVDMEICFALFSVAAWIAVWVDRPRRERRSIAELAATSGALLAAAAVLILPGTSGHAGQTSPRGLSLLLDWLHLVSGSVWLGGLVGLLVVWASLSSGNRVAGLAVTVPRFSNVAFVSVLLLIATGTGATIIHLPILAALWQTSWGKAILVKIGLLLAAMVLAAFNLLRTKPHLVAAPDRPELGPRAASMLRRLVTGEAVIVACAVLAAAVLTSFAPPAKALGQVGSAVAHVGPGQVVEVVHKNGYTIKALVSPNRAAIPNNFALQLTRGTTPVRGADVTLQFAMLDMQMANQEYQLTETRLGIYSRAAPALVMVGHWGLTYTITPRGGQPFSVLIVDHATG
jgi:copper transport protein